MRGKEAPPHKEYFDIGIAISIVKMQDTGSVEITGTGAVYAQVKVYPNFVFENIAFAEGIVENTTGLYNATPYNIYGSSFGLAVRTTNDSAISTFAYTICLYSLVEDYGMWI